MKTLLVLFSVLVAASGSSLRYRECLFEPKDWCSSYEAALSCGVLKQCAKFLLSHNEAAAPPVEVGLYSESLCPFCQQFTKEQLLPTWKTLESTGIMKVAVYPYGNARETQQGNKWVFQCQHGPAECVGNLILTCAIDILKTTAKWLPFLGCVEEKATSSNMAKVAQECAKQQGIDYSPINTCANGDRGNQLEHNMALKTNSLNPPHKYVPWITINGKHTEDIQREAQNNLLAYVCKTYTGTKPAACSSDEALQRCSKRV